MGFLERFDDLLERVDDSRGVLDILESVLDVLESVDDARESVHDALESVLIHPRHCSSVPVRQFVLILFIFGMTDFHSCKPILVPD